MQRPPGIDRTDQLGSGDTSLLGKTDQDPTNLRYAVYGLLIATSVAAMIARVFSVSADHGKTPFLSANDRSRWCTVRALVDQGTYAIDEIIIDPQTGERNPYWYTIDLVRHKARDGQEHYYSSKPTLFPTLVAAQYWLIKNLAGVTLAEQPFYVARLILIVTNVLPLIVYFVLLCHAIEKYGQTDWGRLFVMASATWGTFLTSFAVTLNNHLPAAISALIAVHVTLAIRYDGQRRWWYFAAAGFFAAFTAANELPALSFFAAILVIAFWHSPRQACLAFLPAAAVVAAGFFYTNHLAHGSWRPAYAHRKDGELLVRLPGDLEKHLKAGPISPELLENLNQSQKELTASVSSRAQLREAPILPQRHGAAEIDKRWVLFDPDGEDRWAILSVRGEPSTLQVHAWDNWYQYDGSYWQEGVKRGVDVGEKSRFVYTFHLLIGHHGIYSLTPIWLLSIVGIGMLMVGPNEPLSRIERALLPIDRALQSMGFRKLLGTGHYDLRLFAYLVLLITVVCILFYAARPQHDRNYGGVTCGLRWMFWFTPMWLLCELPAADALASSPRWRAIGLGLLAISVLSASYGAMNPWVHPWIYTYLSYLYP